MWRGFFKFIHNLLALIGFISLVLGAVGLYLVLRSYNLPSEVLVQKALNKAGLQESPLAELVKPAPVRPEGLVLPDLNASDWQGHGARRNRDLTPVVYDLGGRPVPLAWSQAYGTEAAPAVGDTRIVEVSDSVGLKKAIKGALPGDKIMLQPGTYNVQARSIEITRGGTRTQPVMVSAARLGDVVIELDSLEGFWVNAPYWTFENLEIKGVTPNHDFGEHAFHIVGEGRGFVLRNSRIHEFNSIIKANGVRGTDGQTHFPDDALIENNHFYNSEVRRTSHAVTFIDVVGANNWIVRGNLIADFSKGEGDRISYAAFIKGNSSGGVFENNLVVGEYATTGGVRVGLSFGGGGSGAQFCRGRSNEVEHTGGIIRNNIVMFCKDAGLYLNKARDTKVHNNIFYRTMGVDVRFPVSSAVLRNNLLSSRIKERDGGVALNNNNLFGDEDDFADWFVDPDKGNFKFLDGDDLIDKGAESELSKEDFCGAQRIGTPDLGALEASGEDNCRVL